MMRFRQILRRHQAQSAIDRGEKLRECRIVFDDGRSLVLGVGADYEITRCTMVVGFGAPAPNPWMIVQ